MPSRCSHYNYKEENDQWLGKIIKLHQKCQTDQQESILEVSKISQDKLPLMPEESAHTFHHIIYSKPKIDIKEAKILEETWHNITNIETEQQWLS